MDPEGERCSVTSLIRNCYRAALGPRLSAPIPNSTHTLDPEPWLLHAHLCFGPQHWPLCVCLCSRPQICTDSTCTCISDAAATTTVCYSLSWTTEPLSSASACVPVPSSVAVPCVHTPKAQNYWWQVSALDPGVALVPWVHMLQISGLSLFHGYPSIRQQCHHHHEGTCKPNLAPTEIPLDVTSLIGKKEMRSSQQHSWQWQMLITLAWEDACHLHQYWPKLTERHGDYVTYMAYPRARTETAHPAKGEGLFPPEPACKVWKR